MWKHVALWLLLAGSAVHADPAPPTAIRSGWCVIVDTQAYDAFDAAAKSAARARTAGYANAGVYDPRDFTNLGLGALAVIAVGGLPTAAAANADVKVLVKAKLGAYAKQCLPTASTAMPITSAALLRPREKGPSGARIHLDPAALKDDLGCFAWSAKWQSAACIVGGGSNQEGFEWSLAFQNSEVASIVLPRYSGYRRSDPLDPLPRELAKTIDEALAKGEFVPITDVLTRPLELDGHVDWVAPRFSVRWNRKSPIEIRCGGLDQPFITALTVDEPDKQHQSQPAVTLIAGTRMVLVTNNSSYSRDGEAAEHGSYFSAALVDLDHCDH